MENCNVTPRPKTIRDFFKSKYFWKPFLSIVIGGFAGFLYYYFVGCTSGSCPITSSPYGSILVGAIFGFFITNGPCKTC